MIDISYIYYVQIEFIFLDVENLWKSSETMILYTEEVYYLFYLNCYRKLNYKYRNKIYKIREFMIELDGGVVIIMFSSSIYLCLYCEICID